MADVRAADQPLSVNDVKTLGERLRETYDPGDFVTVQNIDTSPVTYQFTNPDDIETYSEYPGHKDTIQKKPPTVVTLYPGETRFCPAYEADLMIETLIKQITTKRTESGIQSGELVKWQSTNWNDPTTQNELISQIYLGKKDIFASENQNIADKASAEVEKDLNAKPKVSK